MACCFRYEPYPGDEERGCQFDLETAFTTLDDTTWCRFHLPMHDAAGNDSHKAGWDDSEIDQFNQTVFNIIDAAIDAGDEGDRRADLTGVVFPDRIDFKRYDKEHPFPHILFRHTTFSGFAVFEKTTFSSDADFAKAAFSNFADFEEATFLEYADFNKVAFSKAAFFHKAVFLEYVDFTAATFSVEAVFRETSFSTFAFFNDTTFSEDADFSGAAETPGGGGRRYDIRLKGASDGDAAWKAEGEAVLPTTPSRSTFRRVDFSGATFGGAADFNNRRFTDTTSFRGAIFERAPKFHNAVLHQDTDFEEANFRDFRSINAERNYRTLKLAMETVRSRREEAMFFALEQRSLRNQPTTPRTVRWASAFYDWAAEYGLSFVRPLWRMVQLFAVSWLSFWTLFGFFSAGQGPPLGRGADIFLFGLQQVFRPFEVWSWRYEIAEPFKTLGIDELPLLIKAVATAETLVTYGLFTLFLLALRKRFRML